MNKNKTQSARPLAGFKDHRSRTYTIACLLGCSLGCAVGIDAGASQTASSPIAITSDDALVWSVNPDNNSVSVFNVAGDANVRVAEIPVGNEPRRLAITPDDNKVYVTDMAGGTVSVIDTTQMTVVKTVLV